jgi:methylglyoxal synthase
LQNATKIVHIGPEFCGKQPGISKFTTNFFMADKRVLHTQKRIALVAHDKKKKDLVEWSMHNREVLAGHELIATGTTGKLLEEKLDLPVKKLFSGPLGGDQQIGSLIAEGRIDLIVFFWDPMEAQPHDSDVKALLRLAVAWNILMACNRTTADFILTSHLMRDDYVISTPDYSNYLARSVS